MRWPIIRLDAQSIVYRNFLVWIRLIGAAIALNIGQPLLYLLGIGIGLGFFVGEMNGMPYLTFLATGIAASSVMHSSSFEGMYSVFTRMIPQKTYEAMLATPLDLDDILTAEMIWCGFKGLLSGTAIILVAFFLQAIPNVGIHLLLILPILFLLGLCFSGFAIAISALAPNYDFFEYYFTLIITPLMLLCGVFYPTTSLPEWIQNIIYFLPLTYAIDLIRGLVAEGMIVNGWMALLILLIYTLIGYYLAALLLRKRLII